MLGDDTVIKWYGEYAQKFSIESLNARRKPLMLDDLQTDEQGRVNAEMLKLPKEQILKYILDRNVVLNNVCGCSGKGCGAGCMCNSIVTIDGRVAHPWVGDRRQRVLP